MSALAPAQKECFEELRHFDAEEKRIDREIEQIEDEIEKLRTKMKALSIKKKDIAEERKGSLERLQKMTIDGGLSPVSLYFEEKTKVIHWDGGSVKLSKIPFNFFKALHDAPNRQLSWNDIEEKVWGESKDGAIHTTASRLRKALKKHKCPSQLVSLNRKTWIPDEEYLEDQSRSTPKIKTITGFRLE
jgi:hypothetical protein